MENIPEWINQEFDRIFEQTEREDVRDDDDPTGAKAAL